MGCLQARTRHDERQLTHSNVITMVETRRRRPSPIDTTKSPPASPAKAPFPVIKLPAAFTVDAAELGADVLASKMAALDVVAVVKTAAAVRKAPRRMMSVKKAPQTVKKKKPKPKAAPPPPCLKTVFKALPHACRSTDSELRAIERRVATLDVHAAVETKGGWEGPPSRSLLGLPPPALHIDPTPAPAPAEDRPATPIDDAAVAAEAAADALAAAAAATFDEDTICSSDASEEAKTAEERLAARDAARAANDFVDAAADADQVRPPLHSPETFLHLRESHSKYYRYY